MTTEEESTPTTEPEAPVTEESPGIDEGNREAARYRRQLRDTEAERDALRHQVTVARVQLAETALTGITPALFWSAVDTGDLDATVSDDGTVDLAAIADLADRVRLEHGIPRRPAPDPSQGNRAAEAGAAPSWTDALRRA